VSHTSLVKDNLVRESRHGTICFVFSCSIRHHGGCKGLPWQG